MQFLRKISNGFCRMIADICLKQGSAFLNRSFNEYALRASTQALGFNPKLTEAYAIRGRARYRLGDYAGAIADYSIAIRLDRKRADIYLNRGLTHYAKAEIEDALADMNIALYRDPHLVLAYNYRGLVEELAGNIVAAIADYSEAIRMNPEFDLAYTNRGSARANEGDFSGAIADYRRYLALGGGQHHADQSRVEALIDALYGRLENQTQRPL